jgi:RHS repeat-associated protein
LGLSAISGKFPLRLQGWGELSTFAGRNKYQMTIEKRKLLWDEENRLEAIDDNIYVSNYWHDAAGNSSVSQSIETDYIGNNVADATGAVQQVTHYYPYGKPISSTSSEQNLQPYKYSGKEQETMMGLAQYDFHARTLDYTYARFTTQDPLAEKYYNISPYAYCAGNPMRFIDPDGCDVYMLFYTTGNGRGDEMFYAAALTRQRDIMRSTSFDPQKDIVVLSPVTDLAAVSGQVSAITGKYSEQYGQTAEFSMWSHAGIDGPTGTAPTSANAIDTKQMSVEGWSQINFNWGEDAAANFLGCKTGVAQDGKASFVTLLSALLNFRDVSVSGQTSSAYPSLYTNYRTNSDWGGDDFVNIKDGKIYFAPTYMVGGISRSQDLNRNEQNVALPMRTSVNGRGSIPNNNYQEGTTKDL